MKRRGFLRALVGAAVAPMVAQAAPLFPITPTPATNLPEPGDSTTFRRNPGYFDMVCYLGDGARKELQRVGFDAALIIVKCQTAPSPWYILESSELPPELNKPGQRYVAYEFGEDAMHQLAPYMDKINQTFVRI